MFKNVKYTKHIKFYILEYKDIVYLDNKLAFRELCFVIKKLTMSLIQN